MVPGMLAPPRHDTAETLARILDLAIQEFGIRVVERTTTGR